MTPRKANPPPKRKPQKKPQTKIDIQKKLEARKIHPQAARILIWSKQWRAASDEALKL
jgi:hypothetical protein